MPNGPDRVDLVYTSETSYDVVSVANASSYIWEIEPSFAGSLVDNGTVTTVTWSPEYLGNVSIRIKALNACGESVWSVDKVTFVDNTTGVTSYDAAKDIVLYPNPNNGIFFIQSSEPLSRVILFDQVGKPISEVNTPTDGFEYNYSSLPVGVYFVHVTIKKTTTIKKIVITH
jgi:hypothetical protein